MSIRNLGSCLSLAWAFLLLSSLTGCGGEGGVGGGIPSPTPPISWRGTQQLGTTGNDVGRGIALDSSTNIYITGSTDGNLDGNTSSGLLDTFLTKFDSSGNKLFTRQFGTPFDDVGYGIAVDSSGNVYITGSTFGDLDGNTSAGLLDVFLAKFDSSGNPIFIQQFGTTGNDIGYGVAVDSAGNVYVTGSTAGTLGAGAFGLLDVFLAKFDSSGNPLFIRQFGTTGNDIGHAVAVDSAGNVYVTGSTAGTLGASAFGSLDVFLAKFDSSGNPPFIQQFGTPFNDVGYGIAVDSGNNVNITGSTFGDLDSNTSAGLLDIFLTKFDSSGNKLFTQQLGTPFNDIGYGVAVDSSNNAYITGSTAGNLDSNTSSGLLDIFLTKYNPSGVKQ